MRRVWIRCFTCSMFLLLKFVVSWYYVVVSSGGFQGLFSINISWKSFGPLLVLVSPNICQSIVKPFNTEMIGKYIKIHTIMGSGMSNNKPMLPLPSFLQNLLLRNETQTTRQDEAGYQIFIKFLRYAVYAWRKSRLAYWSSWGEV